MLEAIAVLVAGVFAGGINTVVGSGTLVTFPVLLAIGYPPVVANVSNTVGLVPGSVSGAIGYREELAGQRERVLRLGVASLLGGITGAVLLLTLPASAFEAIVPVLIAIALVLVELEVEALAPRLEQVRAVAAAERGARDPVALVARDDRHAHEVGEVARGDLLALGDADPALLGDARRVDEVHVLLRVAGEHAVEHGDREQAGVALGDPAQVLDLDALDGLGE